MTTAAGNTQPDVLPPTLTNSEARSRQRSAIIEQQSGTGAPPVATPSCSPASCAASATAATTTSPSTPCTPSTDPSPTRPSNYLVKRRLAHPRTPQPDQLHQAAHPCGQHRGPHPLRRPQRLRRTDDALRLRPRHKAAPRPRHRRAARQSRPRELDATTPTPTTTPMPTTSNTSVTSCPDRRARRPPRHPSPPPRRPPPQRRRPHPPPRDHGMSRKRSSKPGRHGARLRTRAAVAKRSIAPPIATRGRAKRTEARIFSSKPTNRRWRLRTIFGSNVAVAIPRRVERHLPLVGDQRLGRRPIPRVARASGRLQVGLIAQVLG
jgi:hypothetical protein